MSSGTRWRVLAWLALCWLGLWSGALQAQAVLPLPPLSARVMDQTGTLDAATLARLEARLAAFEQSRGTQVVVLMVPTTAPEDIADYTQRLGDARRWVLAAGSVVVALLYGYLAWQAYPLMEISADERSPIMGVPGSVTVLCLMLGFALLALVTVCQIPSLWNPAAADSTDTDTNPLIGADA